MKKIITILFVFTFPFLLKGNDELKLPELVSPTEDGINFTFWLKEAKAGESGDMVLSLWAKSEEKPVAIELILGTKWKPIELSTAETKQYLGSASLRSIGAETERLSTAIAKAYGIEQKESTFTETEMVATITGGGTPAKIGSEGTWIQVIHSAMTREDFTKFYFYIDVPNRVVEIVEEEKKYRKGTVNMFTQGNRTAKQR